jgi:excisionase family DNA binding protein
MTRTKIELLARYLTELIEAVTRQAEKKHKSQLPTPLPTPPPITKPTEPQPKEDYFNKKELAVHLNVCARTIDNLMKRGLPYIKFTSKLVRFPRSAVDDWVKERTVRRR